MKSTPQTREARFQKAKDRVSRSWGALHNAMEELEQSAQAIHDKDGRLVESAEVFSDGTVCTSALAGHLGA